MGSNAEIDPVNGPTQHRWTAKRKAPLCLKSSRVLCAVLSLFAHEVLMIMSTPEYYRAATVVPHLVPSILLSSAYAFAPGFWLAQKTGVVAIASIFSTILNSISNFTFVPVLGIEGVALATIVSTISAFSTMSISVNVILQYGTKASGFLFGAAIVALIRYFGCHSQSSELNTIVLNLLLILFNVLTIFDLKIVALQNLRQDWLFFARGLKCWSLIQVLAKHHEQVYLHNFLLQSIRRRESTSAGVLLIATL